MKRLILILYYLLLLSAGLLYAQFEKEKITEEKIFELEKQIEIQKDQRAKFLHKSDSLALSIQNLKNEKSLNVFQRQQLEQLLKSSQKNDQQLKILDQEVFQLEKHYQKKIKMMVDWLDQNIDSVLKNIYETDQSTEEKKSAYDKAKTLKTKRDFFSKKLKPLSITNVSGGTVVINEFDSYQKIKQKADLLKDQEEKIRKQKQLLAQQTVDLENELKLRNRMNELISDTYLMDYNTDISIQSTLSIEQKSGTEIPLDYNEIRSGGIAATAASPLDAADIIILQTDVSDISTLDLERYIRRLKLVNKQLGKSADSLQVKANSFYRAAEKKKRK